MNGGAILQPMEYWTLKNLNQPWTKELEVWKTSADIPTAPLILFGETSPAIEKIKQVLLNMGADPEGAEILRELRLKGFDH